MGKYSWKQFPFEKPKNKDVESLYCINVSKIGTRSGAIIRDCKYINGSFIQIDDNIEYPTEQYKVIEWKLNKL